MIRLYYSTTEDWDGNEIVCKISLTPLKECYYIDLDDSEIWNLDIEEKLPYTGTFRIQWGFYDPETGIFGNEDTPEIPTNPLIIKLIGIFKSNVTPIPIAPEVKPTINVSALNTREISFLEAPIALKIPISLVLSRTEI